MPKISSSELRARLAEALRSAEGGEPVVITRHGKPAAALIAADQVPRMEPRQAGEGAPDGESPAGDGEAAAPGAEPTPEELLERAAAPSRRRIELDLARLPAKLKPVLVTIRENLFQPGLTVKLIKRALGVGANDLTTRFRDATGAPIREYFENRRLESASRLLVDTELDVQTIARLVGHRKGEVFARAFKRRYGVRPPAYREFDGKLSREAMADAAPGRAPVAPRYLAGFADLTPGALCARCSARLEPVPGMRVFEDLAPICGLCAREQAPELAALLDAEGAA